MDVWLSGILYDHAKFDTQGGCRMVGVVPQIRISGVETTKYFSGSSGRVSNPKFIPVLQIGVSNPKIFRELNPRQRFQKTRT